MLLAHGTDIDAGGEYCGIAMQVAKFKSSEKGQVFWDYCMIWTIIRVLDTGKIVHDINQCIFITLIKHDFRIAALNRMSDVLRYGGEPVVLTGELGALLEA